MTSPSDSLASDLFWPEIWGDLVKISRDEQRTEREQIMIFFKILNSDCTIFTSHLICNLKRFSLSETNEGSEEVTIIEELLIDLLQLVHGTIKKLIAPEDSQDEDGNNEDSNNTLVPIIYFFDGRSLSRHKRSFFI